METVYQFIMEPVVFILFCFFLMILVYIAVNIIKGKQ